MFRSLRHHSVKFLLGLGLLAAGQGLLSAQMYPGIPYGPMAPPMTSMPPMPPGGYPGAVWADPHALPTYGPTYPAAPDHDSDGSVPGDDPHAAPVDGEYVEPPATTGKGLIGCNDVLSAVTMLGRGEALNRFNIFNNMSALPQCRVWYGYQSLSDFRTGFGDHGLPTLPLAQYRIVQLQQLGAEWALGSLCSIAVQGQYVQSTATNADNDAWSNPQVMLKWAAISTCSTVISPVVAGLIQTTQTAGQLHERTSRIQPGLLFYQACGDCAFLQGAAQVSIPFTTGATTVDYGLSWGWWLYRDGSLDVAGRRTQTWERTALPLVTGIIPMMEIWGKNVVAGANQVPLTPVVLPSTIPGLSYQYSGYSEARNVYDVTTGLRFLLYNHFSLGLAYAFPLTGRYTYSDGFLASLNMNF